MCVILLCDTKRPDEEMVEKAWAQNSHGGGIAYRDGGFVNWEKGLDLKDMKRYAKELPFPFVLHFRIASVGGRSDYLCHPFHISADAGYELEGKTKTGVVFHNGTWTNWRYSTMNAMITAKEKIPTGPWSDTRAMALMAYHFGGGALEMINERTVYFTPEELEIYGDGWEEEGDILMSNTIFLRKFQGNTTVIGASGGNTGSTQGTTGTYAGGSGMASGNGGVQGLKLIGPSQTNQETIHVISASERASGGPSLGVSFRGSIAVVATGQNQQERVEEDSESVLEATVERGRGKQLTKAEEDLLEQWEWARSRQDHKKRVDAKAKGIDYIGRM